MLDATTGRLLRTTPVDLAPQAVVLDERTGRVFVACNGLQGEESTSVVDVLDTATDKIVTTTPLGVDDFGPQSMAVDEAAGRIYVSTNREVAVLNATTGQFMRWLSVPDRGAVAVAPHTHRAFVIGPTSFTMIDTATLSVLASSSSGVPLPGNTIVVAVDARTNRVFYLYGDIHAGYLKALDARTGNERYTVSPLEEGTSASVLMVDEQHGHVFADTGSSAFVGVGIYDSATGKQLHVTNLGPQDALPYRAGGTQFGTIDASANTAFVLTGPLNQTHSPRQYTDEPSTHPGSLVVFDAISGQVRSHQRVGRDPQAVAVDPQRKRVFVANRGDDTVSVFDATKL